MTTETTIVELELPTPLLESLTAFAEKWGKSLDQVVVEAVCFVDDEFEYVVAPDQESAVA